MMGDELPDNWFIEHDGQRLILDPAKVLAEIKRLEKKIYDMEDEAESNGIERNLIS